MTTPSLAIERHRLENGLRVVLHRDPTLPLVSVNLWIHVGSKHERPGRTGLAHLFEHLMFQGSAHVGRNEHFQRIQEVGGVANGSTWYDRTNYYETVPAERLELALWLESDRLGHFLPALDQQKLDIQRGVVLNERRQRVDNQPYGRAWERLFEMLYPEASHPYRWPVLGYVPDLEETDLEDVRTFFSTWYTPRNTVLTLAGDLPDDALKRVEAWFGDIAAGPETSRPLVAPGGLAEDTRDEMPDDVSLSRLYLGWHVPRYGTDEWYATDLLSAILTSGKSSPLVADLVLESQVAQDVGAYVFPTEETAIFGVISTARPGASTATLENAIHLALEEVATEGPREADLERARARRRVAEWGRLQTLDSRADLLSRFTTFFDAPEHAGREAERYGAVGADDVRAAAVRLRESASASLSVVPEGGR